VSLASLSLLQPFSPLEGAWALQLLSQLVVVELLAYSLEALQQQRQLV
jgi:hypothetical protein